MILFLASFSLLTNKCPRVYPGKNVSGFMLIEVLVALAIFGLSAVYLVDGAFVASRTIRLMKDARELEQDLLWVRSQVLAESSYEKFEEGGRINRVKHGRNRMGGRSRNDRGA